MEFFPFFRRPYYYYNKNGYINPSFYNQNVMREEKQRQANYNKEEPRKDSIQAITSPKDTKRTSEDDNPLFEIFGIKLFFDDVLIIALLFFLYNEGVEDKLLFISLILILLS